MTQAPHTSYVSHLTPYPLTDVQRAYLLGRQDGTPLGGTGCHMTFEFDHDRAPDQTRLQDAYHQLQQRHVSLRTAFNGLDQGAPLASPTGRLVTDDLRGADPATVAGELDRIRERMAHRRLDVAAGRVMDLGLTLLPGGGSRLHADIDLLAADPVAIRVLFEDLVALYDGELPDVSLDFADHRRRGSHDNAERDERRTGRAGDDASAPRTAPRLPYATEPEELAGVPRFTRRQVAVPGSMWRRIQDRARACGISARAVPFAAFCATLHRWQADPAAGFVLNTPTFDRPGGNPQLEGTVGDFSRLTAARVPGGAPSDLRALAHGSEGVLRAQAPAVGDFQQAARGRGQRTGMLGVVYTELEHSWVSRRFTHRFGSLTWMLSHTPQVWLDCLAHPVSDDPADGYVLAWDAVEEVFLPGTLDAMTEYCDDVLRAFADRDWSSPVPQRLPARQRQTRARVNDTTGPESGLLLHQSFFELAAADATPPALHHENTTLTRGELAERALRLAARLRDLGVRGGEPVGICLTSGEAQVTAALGVMAAGGCYVPIGPEQPAQRRDQVLGVSGARVVICDPEQATTPGERRPDDGPLRLSWQAALDPGQSPLPEPVLENRETPAYIIFTSGSTGTPKGVEVSHRSAVNSLEDLNGRWDVGPADCCLSVSALDFDLSVYEIFGPLMAGGRVVMPGPEERRDPEAWLRLIETHAVTVWDSVPVLLDMLITAGELRGATDSLRLVLTGGDWIGTDLPGRLHRLLPSCHFVACGGATEGAVYSNFHEVTETDHDWPSVPYGTPLRNQHYRAVDVYGRDCPDWVPGELWIGGTGVALGYRADPDRTAERFVERDGMRWYLTGDLGRYRPDGVLEFLGRADHQIKLNGYRIELGEIEGVLGRHPAVGRAVAVLAGTGAGRRIVAYLVPQGDGVDLDDVRDHTRRWLPSYTQPADYLLLPELPLNGNGKVDRKQLISWAAPPREPTPQEPPRPGTEQALAQEWAGVLGPAPASRHDNFYDLGADSLLTMRLALAVNDRFGTEIPLRELQASATLADMARAVDTAQTTTAADLS
ncbi:non-ribosomal peptide synthetase [Streptomyces sp. NBC_00356]|uniref:non-ribosomal peptide synthetase n=1 Tax=Streptomyces sp. NBC_00356 TaxID=2975724 RepID=UPI002E25C7DF